MSLPRFVCTLNTSHQFYSCFVSCCIVCICLKNVCTRKTIQSKMQCDEPTKIFRRRRPRSDYFCQFACRINRTINVWNKKQQKQIKVYICARTALHSFHTTSFIQATVRFFTFFKFSLLPVFIYYGSFVSLFYGGNCTVCLRAEKKKLLIQTGIHKISTYIIKHIFAVCTIRKCGD